MSFTPVSIAAAVFVSPLLMGQGPVAPAWAILPVGLIAEIVIGIHVLAVMRSSMPPSRRRIRVANGLLMMFTTPLMAFAFCLVDHSSQPRLFAMTWVLVFGLLTLIIGLACMDMLNNVRLYRAEHREKRLVAARLRQDLRLRRDSDQSVTAPVASETKPHDSER